MSLLLIHSCKCPRLSRSPAISLKVAAASLISDIAHSIRFTAANKAFRICRSVAGFSVGSGFQSRTNLFSKSSTGSTRHSSPLVVRSKLMASLSNRSARSTISLAVGGCVGFSRRPLIVVHHFYFSAKFLADGQGGNNSAGITHRHVRLHTAPAYLGCPPRHPASRRNARDRSSRWRLTYPIRLQSVP